MVASAIGVALLAILLELCRRAGKEYDTSIASQIQKSVTAAAAANPSLLVPSGDASGSLATSTRTITLRVSPFQQAIRALIHAITFAVAYIVMLLVMSFNGYIIVAVFIGAGFGKFLTDWMEVDVAIGGDGAVEGPGKPAQMQDATVCCG